MVGSEVAIQEGAHTITHISPVATFSGYVYGTADRESYSFQMGARLAPINQVCFILHILLLVLTSIQSWQLSKFKKSIKISVKEFTPPSEYGRTYLTIMFVFSQPCVKTESVFGDGVDNDCDGLIDEELCTGANRGTDTDGDEFTDEDCALIREVLAGKQ